MEIVLPRCHDKTDNSLLSYRFTEVSEDGTKAAVQVLTMDSCDDENVYLSGTITSNFSAVTGKVYFMLTGVNDENITAKYQSAAYIVSDDLALTALPDETAAEKAEKCLMNLLFPQLPQPLSAELFRAGIFPFRKTEKLRYSQLTEKQSEKAFPKLPFLPIRFILFPKPQLKISEEFK